MSVNQLLEGAFNKLREFPQESHLCCPRISDEDDEIYEDVEAPSKITVAEKEERIQQGKERLNQAYICSLILGLEEESAGSLGSEFKERTNGFLKSCATCVRNWHKGRKPFLKDIGQIYDDNVVTEMEDRLNQFDFLRITKGLEGAAEFINAHNGVAGQSTFLKEDREDLLIALYEAICCMPYLSLPENRKQFNFVFEAIQKRKILKLDEILPTMTFFLFDENDTRNRFAVHTFSRHPSVTEEDFEWAINDNLADAILKANDINASPQFLLRFWQGFLHILDVLDEKLVIHSLRGMTVQPSIYELMLAQMSRIHSVPILKLLLKAFCALIRKSPKAFWDAYSHYSHTAVAEQILVSPAFKSLLLQSGEPDVSEGPTAISWVKSFVESIPTHQKSDVCDSLLHHFLQRYAQDPNMTSGGKVACTLVAVEILSSTLGTFASPNYKLHVSSSTIHTNAVLNLTLKYKDLIIQLAQLPPDDQQNAAMSHAGLSVIKYALTLDSRIIVEEFSALQNSDKLVQREVKRNSPGLWEAFLEILQPGADELAKIMLVATGPLIAVEIFRPVKRQTLSPTKKEFNIDFQKTAEVVGRMIERLGDFSESTLRQLCSDPSTILPIVAALVHGEQDINQAGASFIKTVTNEMRRTDAVLRLLEGYFTHALSSYTSIVTEITEKMCLWSPQFNVIRYSRDILSSLCDPTSGILRSKDLNNREREVLGAWWNAQWRFLDNAFTQTEDWSRLIDMETMKNFCREAMEFAEALLAQDGLLASALSSESAHSSSMDNGEQPEKQAMRDILEQPRKYSFGLCKMLRLKDLYLVTVIVNVLGKLLRRLVEFDIELPSQALTFVKNTCIKNKDGRYNTSTNMNDRQRAELLRALGEDTQDDVEIISIKKAEPHKRQSRLDAWSKSADDTSGTPSAPSISRKGKIPVKTSKDDLRDILKSSTSEKTKSTLDIIKARHAERKPAQPVVNVASIREKRQKEAEEKRKRDAEVIARAKALRQPKPLVSGEGSGLQGLSGVHGKDHAPQKSEIMVNSSSEDEDDSDGDAEFLARSAAGKKGAKGGQSAKPHVPLPVKKVKIQRSAKDMRARLIPPMDILHQAILEWDIFHKGNDPPNGIRCSKVSDAYGDPREYKETFLPLLINEAWRSFVTAKDEATSKPFGIKIVNRMNVDKFVEVSTAMPISENKDRFLSEGDIVLFSQAANPLEATEDLHCLARIWRVQFKNGNLEVQFRLSGRAGPIISTMMPKSELYAVKITNMTTIEREYASLESLQYYDLMPEVLEAKPSPMLKFSQEAVEKIMENYQLNPGQAKAILNAKENDAFTLVQGPPGTGKTKTIVAMVGALLTGNFSTNTGTAIKRPTGPGSTASKGLSKKLLVCAPSNAAVDELVLRLKNGVKSTTGSFHKVNVLRLGRTDAINAAVRDVTLDEMVKARVEGTADQNKGPSSRDLMHQEAGKIKLELADLRPQLESARAVGDRTLINQFQRKFDELKRRQAQIGAKIDADKDSGNTVARENEIRRRQIQQEILDSAQVLCATLSGSGHEMFKNLQVEFETVIIDEAAQCVELSALIPLKYGCSKCILVGDPKQLPPTVLSQSAARYGYDQSLFVRMQRNHPDDVHLLDTQYRMHPEISLFPSQEFYERRLLDGDDMRKLRHQPWHQSALLGPYRFFDVKGIQDKGRKGQSLINLEELKVAMQLYERLMTDYPNADWKGKIGIITPYKAQLFELRDQFSRRYGEKIKEYIEFNTTDAFQGRECEIIIFSCVRASPTGGIGFMTDIRRMNVGLTRAKSSLFILGDSRALVQGEFWNKLIEDAKIRDRYTAGDVLSLLRRPGAKLPPTSFDTQPTPAQTLPQPMDTSDPSSKQSSRASSNEDVVMEDAPPSNRAPKKKPTPQLPQTYTVLERQEPRTSTDNSAMAGYGGLNERGETATVNRSSERPVIHQSGQKRPRDGSEDGKAPKRVRYMNAKRYLKKSLTLGNIGCQHKCSQSAAERPPKHAAAPRPFSNGRFGHDTKARFVFSQSPSWPLECS
ncbi:SEN1 N terminal-domain-containing protein [Annulohypoxylon truncatum]|uniref:SEN1 N terminal-domain-containing protein n=1 Tax=Annulohypoxylon truncatum TaxID=327061 RepID=UPI002007802F|nr:SEN1 N terminal-domain-containing protein [Annulohypoxylon truncatum]KAI1212701.1 SEN1 N terminal-domain-containing protein [Annulohypoxylon truncatum]